MGYLFLIILLIAATLLLFQLIKWFINNNPNKMEKTYRFEEFINGKPVPFLTTSFSNWCLEVWDLIKIETPDQVSPLMSVLEEFYNRRYLPSEVVEEFKSIKESKAA